MKEGGEEQEGGVGETGGEGWLIDSLWTHEDLLKIDRLTVTASCSTAGGIEVTEGMEDVVYREDDEEKEEGPGRRLFTWNIVVIPHQTTVKHLSFPYYIDWYVDFLKIVWPLLCFRNSAAPFLQYIAVLLGSVVCFPGLSNHLAKGSVSGTHWHLYCPPHWALHADAAS